MAISGRIVRMKQVLGFLTILLVLCFALESKAQVPDKVTTYKDENGWKLKVNGKDYYVKGVVWGYTPIGENFAYNLWGKPDDYIKKVLDYEGVLMKGAGINTIRYFGAIPPRWVAYLYNEYGIMTIINHLMGRYGYKVGGAWRPVTDYSDPLTRATLKKDILEMVAKYKDTPGVLMFALGNESNYGLEWSASFEIENLPTGEKHREKAKHLYSLFNEIMRDGKKIDPNHLFTIVNGDIQYIDLIKEYCTDLDVLGANSYRGISFTEMWKDAKQKLGLPVLITEFGSDAYNAKENMEDQAAQAHFLKGQWKEIYNKSYGKGEEGNAVGGLVFEWRDEWWKYKQTENLFVHDTHASWANGGYLFDYVEGKDNMNEEWFGICRLGRPNADGVSQAEPRMAYDILSEIWHIDPYSEGKAAINNKIDRIDMPLYTLKSDVRQLKSESKERGKIYLSGGSLEAAYVGSGLSSQIKENGQDGVKFSDGEMAFLGVGFQPTENLKGNITFNVLGNVATPIVQPFYYGSRGKSVDVPTLSTADNGSIVTTTKTIKGNERVEIYNFDATYNTDNFDFTGFYHVPRYHWGYEGDFFGLLWEATDIAGMDVWNSKAPNGVEFDGKKKLSGLKVVLGPEVYWGANPKAIAKYTFGSGHFNYVLMYSGDFSRRPSSATATASTSPISYQATAYVKTDIIPRTILEVGGITANWRKVDNSFEYLDGNNIAQDKIRFTDTLGIKAKATVTASDWAKVYVAGNYSGLVADGGNPIKDFGTQLPYSQYGNKKEVEGGILFNFDPVTIYPRALYRTNIIDGNPLILPSSSGTTLYPGIVPRNTDSSPFAVLDNREAQSYELIVTYDPTPATPFYDWDNDMREDADFAFNLGGNYTKFPTITDAYLFFYQQGNINVPFSTGLPDANTWKGFSRIVLNPNPNFRFIAKLEGGKQQSTGSPEGGLRTYYQLDAKIIFKKHTVAGFVKKDAWGPYDFNRQFNIAFPWQYLLDYSYSLSMNKILDPRFTSQIGIKGLYTTVDQNSAGSDIFQNGKNRYAFDVIGYYKIQFSGI